MLDHQFASDEISIPETALQIKAWFWERPNESVRKEILQFIRDRKPVYLCKYHTHTKPPKGARVVYIGEFDIHDDLPMAPCPCCCPVRPKYREGGKIAWFPDEGVIRLIGPDCFKTLNPEGHEEALEQLRAETRRRRTINYLLSQAGEVPAAVKAIKQSLAVAVAIDKARADVQKALRAHEVRLWEEIQSGALIVDEYETEIVKGENGKEYAREKHNVRQLATFTAPAFFNPKTRAFAPRFREVEQALMSISLGDDFEKTIRDAADDERDQWANVLNRSLDKGKRLTTELEETRRALAPEMISTLRRWGEHQGARCPVFMKRDGNDLLVGRTQDDYTRVKRLLVRVWEPLGTLPDVGSMDEL